VDLIRNFARPEGKSQKVDLFNDKGKNRRLPLELADFESE